MDGIPETEISRKLVKMGFDCHVPRLGWYSVEQTHSMLNSGLGREYWESVRVSYNFGRKDEGFSSRMLCTSKGILSYVGEYHHRDGEEDLGIWIEFMGFSEEKKFRSLRNSLEIANLLTKECIPFRTVYHLDKGANVSREEFIKEIRGELKVPSAILDTVRNYETFEGIKIS
jgi:hypothetical protein